MNERLKNPESAWPVDGLRLEHPNTAQAEAVLAESARETVVFSHDRAEPAGSVRELISAWPGQPPHHKSLRRYAAVVRREEGETKSFCAHETQASAGGYFERLVLSQQRWGDCDGRLEVRVHYPAGWERSAAIWLTSRSDVSQEGGYWFEVPNLSLLAVRSYNFLQGLFEHRLLQINHDRGEQTARLLTIRGQAIVGAWGRQARISGLVPEVKSWAFGDSFCPAHYEERLRSLAFGPGAESALAPESALDGLLDCRQIAEAMRAQAESGPVNLARLAYDTGLTG